MSNSANDTKAAKGCRIVFLVLVAISVLNQYGQDFSKQATTGRFFLGALIGVATGAGAGALAGLVKSLGRARMKTLDVGPIPVHRYSGRPERVREKYL